MTVYQVKLPRGFTFLNQFAPSQWAKNPSYYRCAEASAAMATEFQLPGSHIPEHLMDYLYVKFIGPDVSTDTQGTSEAQLEAMLKLVGVKYINLQSLVDEFNKGNRGPLHAELMAQNRQDVMQIITIADESHLHQAIPDPSNPANPYIQGQKLHSWNDAGLSHVITRLGFSDDLGFGLYGEPAAVGFAQPVPILWQNIIDAGILHVWAIMPQGVDLPPSDFLYQNGTWPIPKPLVDTATATSALSAVTAKLQQMEQDITLLQQAAADALKALGK